MAKAARTWADLRVFRVFAGLKAAPRPAKYGGQPKLSLQTGS